MPKYRLIDADHDDRVQVGPTRIGDDPTVVDDIATKVREVYEGRLEVEKLDEATGEWRPTGKVFGGFD
jgi:hypothetical protein